MAAAGVPVLRRNSTPTPSPPRMLPVLGSFGLPGLNGSGGDGGDGGNGAPGGVLYGNGGAAGAAEKAATVPAAGLAAVHSASPA